MGRRYIGIDTGGTFTDFVEINDEGKITFDKAFSTPEQPDKGIMNVLEQTAQTQEKDLQHILDTTMRFSHGSTVATNALIERKGARVGLITTKGFEDTLVIARGPMGRTGGLPYLKAMDFIFTEKPEQLVSRKNIYGLTERTVVTGKILVHIKKDEVTGIVQKMLDQGVESIAVCLLWSFRNNKNEQIVKDIIRKMAPDIPVSISSEISPCLGEFERMVTTVINAYIGPVMDRYIQSLTNSLQRAGFRKHLQIMKSSGGLLNPEDVQNQAIATINSGPIGGLVAAKYLGKLLGYNNIITADMGGTSFDVGLIAEGNYEEETSPFLDQGLPVQIPAIKVVTIGAGGGSIASTDGYRLLVGPHSAGADPGPACYGIGGVEPTVTDALVSLGIINPISFFGGRYALDRNLSLKAIEQKIAKPLNMNVKEAAAGIYEVVTSKMCDLIRKVTVESGYDPREFCLMAYGGATGAHCAAFVSQLGIKNVIIPYMGPVFSAFGIAISDTIYTYVQSEPVFLEKSHHCINTVNQTFRCLQERAHKDFERLQIDKADIIFNYKIDLRYQGQMNEVTINWPQGYLQNEDVDKVSQLFENIYEQKFGKGTTRAESSMELINFRLEMLKISDKPPLARNESSESVILPIPQKRKIYMHELGEVSAEVYQFAGIKPGEEIQGPAVIERGDTTIWITPDCSTRLDEYGNAFIYKKEEKNDHSNRS